MSSSSELWDLITPNNVFNCSTWRFWFCCARNGKSVRDKWVHTTAASVCLNSSSTECLFKGDSASDFSFFYCQCLQILCSPEGVRVELGVGEKVFWEKTKNDFKRWIPCLCFCLVPLCFCWENNWMPSKCNTGFEGFIHIYETSFNL